jgi:hypothetical protein
MIKKKMSNRKECKEGAKYTKKKVKASTPQIRELCVTFVHFVVKKKAALTTKDTKNASRTQRKGRS